jgi:hypothetical protein
VVKLVFDPCFPQDKIVKLSATLPKTYHELDKACPWRRGKWPRQVHCMTDSKIASMRKHGAGHGYTYPRGNAIWMNHYMTQTGYWLVFVHENLHHGYPDATEAEINCVHLPRVYRAVFGRTLDPDFARRHGVGSPVPGVGDRSYCR